MPVVVVELLFKAAQQELAVLAAGQMGQIAIQRQQVRLIILEVALVVEGIHLQAAQVVKAAPVSSSSSTPLLAKPSLYSKALQRGNVLLV
jgi:hypothetical protein